MTHAVASDAAAYQPVPHAAAVARPAVAQMLPAGHGVQLGDPVELWKRPGAHGVHASAAAAEYLPVAHSVAPKLDMPAAGQ